MRSDSRRVGILGQSLVCRVGKAEMTLVCRVGKAEMTLVCRSGLNFPDDVILKLFIAADTNGVREGHWRGHVRGHVWVLYKEGAWVGRRGRCSGEGRI